MHCTIDGDNAHCQVSGLILKQKTSPPLGTVSETELGKFGQIVKCEKCGTSSPQVRTNGKKSGLNLNLNS